MLQIVPFVAGLLMLAWAGDTELPSLRLQRLREAIPTDSQAVEEFWREVRSAGTPLVEPAPDDASQVLVTFLWRGTPAPSEPVVFASVLPNTHPERQRLINLTGTDVWYRTYRFRRDLPVVYEISPSGTQGLRRDPLNPGYLDGPMGGSVAILPGVRNREWTQPRSSLRGRLEKAQFRSKRLGNERSLSVYFPATFRPGKIYDIVVVLDEDVYSGAVPLNVILDNLTNAGIIRPVIAVIVGNADRANEMSCSSAFSSFLAEELLPALKKQYGFRQTRERTTILGSSLGGLAAACAGIYSSRQFGNVIALSGSFRWRPNGDPEPEWLARRVATAPALPVRFLIGVGSSETGTPEEPGNPSLLTASRHLRDVLLAKRYRVEYREFPGAHEPLSWKFAIPDFLRQLLTPAPMR